MMIYYMVAIPSFFILFTIFVCYFVSRKKKEEESLTELKKLFDDILIFYKKYYFKYHISRELTIKNNELTPNELKLLSSTYIKTFFEIYDQSPVVQKYIKKFHGSKDSFTYWLIKDFDLYLFDIQIAKIDLQ